MTSKTDAFKTLYTRLIDSRDGYKDALEHVTNPSLKSTLAEFHMRRERDAEELRGYFARGGTELDDDGSLLASIHRTFLGMKDAVTGSDDTATLAEIVRGEKYLLSAYDDALDAAGAADPEYAFLTKQRAELERAIAQIDTRKDLAA